MCSPTTIFNVGRGVAGVLNWVIERKVGRSELERDGEVIQ